MNVTMDFFKGLMERKSEDCEGVLTLSQSVRLDFFKNCPWFCEDGVNNLDAVFWFVARERATNNSYQRAMFEEHSVIPHEWTDYRRKCLLLSGGCGTGKTTIAAYIAASVKNVELISADVIDFDYATMTNAEFCEKYEELLADYHSDAIVIDDFGGERSRKRYGCSAFTDGLIERLYTQWCFRGSTCVITTNLTFIELQEAYGDRAASRVREMFDFVTFKGSDLRNRAKRPPETRTDAETSNQSSN